MTQDKLLVKFSQMDIILPNDIAHTRPVYVRPSPNTTQKVIENMMKLNDAESKLAQKQLHSVQRYARMQRQTAMVPVVEENNIDKAEYMLKQIEVAERTHVLAAAEEKCG